MLHQSRKDAFTVGSTELVFTSRACRTEVAEVKL